jgi:uncharacterized caspase-like protein
MNFGRKAPSKSGSSAPIPSLQPLHGATVANIAIIVGNVRYDRLDALDCCRNDVHAIKDLLDATEKFDSVDVVLDADSAHLKDRIRAAVDAHTIAEVFFYFTGHGHQHDSEFFLCATNFDSKRPNETGLSNEELHTLLRPADAELVVKVFDACNSGALLVKTDRPFWTTAKQGFRNLIQIASCLDSQNSWPGGPLSVFTEKFIAAALRKPEGPVYYSEIVNALRDEFLNDNVQTPHFVSQGTGREEFVENAARLDGLRAKRLASRSAAAAATPNVPSVVERPTTVLDLLQTAESKFANRETARAFIAALFGKLSDSASSDFFGDLFSSEVFEHPDFREPTTRAFIIRVLSNEKRPDNFVTATVTREQKLRDPWGITRGSPRAFSIRTKPSRITSCT